MINTLQKRCELFIQNRDMIKSAFGWENTYIYPLCAAILSVKGVLADTDRMKHCRELLKQKTSVFSNFRGTSKMATVTMLSFSSTPDQQMEHMLAVYDNLKEVFWGSEYLAVAATSIAQLAEPSEYRQITQRTREIYNRMKEAHPFLTSGEDSAFAALLALSGLDDLYIEQEMERCYTILKPSFFSGNAVQSLSHVLALGDNSAEDKCRKALNLFDSLKSRGRKYGTSYELATLGALVLLDTDVNALTDEMIEVDDYLKEKKDFGAFGIGAKQRLMYAGMLAMNDHIPDTQTMQVAALNGIVSLVIAQQAAICASVAATSAAAASSSSS